MVEILFVDAHDSNVWYLFRLDIAVLIANLKDETDVAKIATLVVRYQSMCAIFIVDVNLALIDTIESR